MRAISSGARGKTPATLLSRELVPSLVKNLEDTMYSYSEVSDISGFRTVPQV